jgi:ribosome-associated protein
MTTLPIKKKPLKYVTRDRQNQLVEQQEAELENATIDKPSKSEQKRRMHRAQELGEVLISLPPSIFRDLPVEESLRDALEHAQSLKSHEALRRQKQLIGKLMREVDCVPIEQFLRARHVTVSVGK